MDMVPAGDRSLLRPARMLVWPADFCEVQLRNVNVKEVHD